MSSMQEGTVAPRRTGPPILDVPMVGPALKASWSHTTLKKGIAPETCHTGIRQHVIGHDEVSNRMICSGRWYYHALEVWASSHPSFDPGTWDSNLSFRCD